MELVDINSIEDAIEYKKEQDVFNDCFVNLDIPAKPLDTMVYIGEDIMSKRCSVITRGEISCIVAMSKTKKSFCKSLITSAFIGGNTNTFSIHIVGNRKTDGYVIDLDTEQGEYYAKKTFMRVEKMVGNRYKNYIPLMMRKKSVNERLEMIDWLVYNSQYSGKIDIIFIDGLADLVYNTNDIEEGAKLAEKMLKWTAEGLHICTIIHKAGNNDKARGHLGTAITIKAESIIFMDALMDDQGNITEKNTVKVRSGYTRGRAFEDFYLTVNNDGLPFTHSDPNDNVFNSNFMQDKEPLPKMSTDDAFGDNETSNEVAF